MVPLDSAPTSSSRFTYSPPLQGWGGEVEGLASTPPHLPLQRGGECEDAPPIVGVARHRVNRNVGKGDMITLQM